MTSLETGWRVAPRAWPGEKAAGRKSGRYHPGAALGALAESRPLEADSFTAEPRNLAGQARATPPAWPVQHHPGTRVPTPPHLRRGVPPPAAATRFTQSCR
jgi:hypothetical protein